MMDEHLRDSLPLRADCRPAARCARCGCIHSPDIMAREDYDQIIRDAAQKLADAVDARLAADVYEKWR